MATLTAGGVGSGLDVNSIVSQLVSAERTPVSQRLASSESKAQVKLSTLGSFRSALDSLQDAVKELRSSGALGSLSASSADESLFTASASGAAAGSYDIEVVQLARGSKHASGTFANADSLVGAGSITLTVDGEAFTVNTSASTTLAQLRDAINSASNNSGAVATIVNETGGARLLLTSAQTGLANAVSVSTSLATFTQIQSALDAHVRVDGYDAYGSSNAMSGVIDGITLKLGKAQPGSTVALTVGADREAAAEAVQSFIKTYNSALSSMTNATKYDPATQKAAPLAGDAALRALNQRLRAITGSASGSGAFQLLAQIGVTGKVDGTLSVDTEKLDAALSSDFNAVMQMFSGSGGYSERLDQVIEDYLGTGGSYQSATETLNKQIKDISRQKDALELRMDAVEARYRAQFTALDTLIGQLKTTSDFLNQQLSSLSR